MEQEIHVHPQAPFQLQNHNEKSADIGKLALALSKAQAKIEGAKKDADNPFFKSSYADLASVWDACHKQLSENELAVTQLVEEGIDRVSVTTILMHSSGQWISGRLSLKPKVSDPQGIGSATTYARRYALAAIAGVCPIDDDGEAAMGRKTEKKEDKPAIVTKEEVSKLTPDNKKKLGERMLASGRYTKEQIKKDFDIEV